jgi:hypothetical protein
MESISTLKGFQAFRKVARRLPTAPLRRKIGESIVLVLIFVFFAIPFAGMSLHCYKYGVPARFLGLVQFFTQWW